MVPLRKNILSFNYYISTPSYLELCHSLPSLYAIKIAQLNYPDQTDLLLLEQSHLGRHSLPRFGISVSVHRIFFQ